MKEPFSLVDIISLIFSLNLLLFSPIIRSWLTIVIRSTVYNFFRKKSTRNTSKNVDYSQVNEANLTSEPEIHRIAEIEWKSYVANMAWINIKNEFTEKTVKIFEMSVEEENTELVGQAFSMSASSVRVYKSRVKKVLLREISRLNQELGG